jgi:hypothetical protein
MYQSVLFRNLEGARERAIVNMGQFLSRLKGLGESAFEMPRIKALEMTPMPIIDYEQPKPRYARPYRLEIVMPKRTRQGMGPMLIEKGGRSKYLADYKHFKSAARKITELRARTEHRLSEHTEVRLVYRETGRMVNFSRIEYTGFTRLPY